MADTSADQDASVTYIAGIDGNGAVAPTSYANWNNNTPATYSPTQGFVHKWYNDSNGVQIGKSATAGTGGGTVTYTFGSGVTQAQQQAFVSDLTLWSDEANISFAYTTNTSSADLVLNVTNGGGTENQSAPQQYSVVGSAAIPTEYTPTVANGSADVITFDNSGGYGTLGSFSAYGGYGVSALTHEVGHMLGLGHSGPYNDGAAGNNPDKQQFNEFDSRQWSVMSYISPDGPSATYYGSYTVTGTNWNITQTNGGGTTVYKGAPETPMIDDITAAQRLYGAPTTTALSGGQTFGFNCNISDASKPFFDFTQNTSPIVTLYDTGTNNTLDLSSYASASNVNLNPGAFTSAAGLTNNIGIAYGTKIDKAIGGAGNDVFTVNADADTIIGGGGQNTAVFSGPLSSYTIAQAGNGTTLVTNTATGVTDTLSGIQTATFSDQSVAVCFCSGTLIRALRGGRVIDVPVEDLVVGDIAVTASGARRAIAWLGHRTLDCGRVTDREAVLPVRIAAHAFGENRPARDLYLSPGHAVCVSVVDEMLIPAGALVNGATVAQVAVERITYWHVELEGGHDILLAENLPAESYIDVGNRAFFIENAVAALDALPDDPAETKTVGDYCRPFVAEGAVVLAVRERLRKRALACGWTLDDTPLAGLHVIADGVVVEPTVRGLSARFVLPAVTVDCWLISGTTVPAHVADSLDKRTLGLQIGGVSIDDGLSGRRAIAIDHPLLCLGFHASEANGAWRWTAGRARLPAALWNGCDGLFFLRIDLAAPALPRWQTPRADIERAALRIAI